MRDMSGKATCQELVGSSHLFKQCIRSAIQLRGRISSIRSIWINYPKGRNTQSVKEADSRLAVFILNNVLSNKAKSSADNTLRKHFSITNNSLRDVFRSYSAASITAHNLPAESAPCATVKSIVALRKSAQLTATIWLKVESLRRNLEFRDNGSRCSARSRSAQRRTRRQQKHSGSSAARLGAVPCSLQCSAIAPHTLSRFSARRPQRSEASLAT